MSQYARSTCVTEGETRGEIKRVLDAHQCSDVIVGLNARGDGVVKFAAHNREIRMLVSLPADPRQRNRLWRVILLTLKAKLEAVDSRIETFEAAFLSYIAMPGDTTVGRMVAKQVREAYQLQPHR